MKKKLKLNDLQVASFITDANEVKGGAVVTINGCLTGTETWNFPCTNAPGCMLPTDPAMCDIRVTNLPVC